MQLKSNVSSLDPKALAKRLKYVDRESAGVMRGLTAPSDFSTFLEGLAYHLSTAGNGTFRIPIDDYVLTGEVKASANPNGPVELKNLSLD